MGMGASLFLLAGGAILAFAVEIEGTSGVDWNAVGIILMAVGAVGVLLSLLFWSSWGWGRRDEIVYDAGPRRRTIIEQ